MDDRFARQTILPEVGPDGQALLARARVLVVGMGGLGCPASLYLATSGIGHLTIIDHDAVEESNLHRQVLYHPGDIGRPKVEAAKDALERIAPGVAIDAWQVALDHGNAEGFVSGHDIVIDGTDRMEARYAIDGACRQAGVPWVHGAVSRHEGQVAAFAPPGPWYSDLWPAASDVPSCSVDGVLPPVPGIVGAMQAQEALLWLLGIPRRRALHVLHTLENRIETVHLSTDRPLEVGLDEVLEADCIVDVREADEYAEGTLARAIHVPLSKVEVHAAAWARRRVVTVCATGDRSRRAAMTLRRLGIDAGSLAGGLTAWRRSGGHLVTAAHGTARAPE